MQALPWLIEELKFKEKRDDVRPDLDIELASIMFLVENFRAGSGKITKKGKKARVNAVLKIHWPIWLATVGDGECVLCDGLKTSNPKALDNIARTAEDVQQQVESLEPTDFLDALNEIQSFTVNPEKGTEIEGLLTSDIFSGIIKYAKYRADDYEFAIPLPSLLKEENVQGVVDYVVGYPAKLDGIFGEAVNIIECLKSKRDQAVATEDEKIAAITTDYDARYAELEAQVNDTIARLGEEEQAEIANMNDVRAKEKENVMSVIKQTIEPFSESIDLVKTTWDDSYGKITSSTAEEELKEEVDHGINLLKQKIADLTGASSSLEDELQGQIDRFGAIDADFDQRISNAGSKFAQRVQDEKDKLTQLDMEKRGAIGEQEMLKQKIDAVLAKCEGNLNQFINRKEEKARILSNMKTACPSDESPIMQFMVPFYYVGIDEELEKFFIAAPPTVLGTQSQKKQDATSYDQKLLPLTVADPSFLTYFDEKFHQLMTSLPEIGDLIRESAKSDQLNLLMSTTMKEQALRGLKNLQGRNLGKPKDLEKVIADVAHDFRA